MKKQNGREQEEALASSCIQYTDSCHDMHMVSHLLLAAVFTHLLQWEGWRELKEEENEANTGWK